MCAWQRKTCVIAITLFLPLLSGETVAQNMLTNPSFDSSLDGWSISPSDPSKVFWTAERDHDGDGTGSGGSVHLNTSTVESFAAQCVVIDPSVTYDASAWAYSACVGHRFYVFWASQEDCADTGDFAYDIVKTTLSNQWQNVSMTVVPPAGSSRAVVTLVNPSGCSSGAYFDDVMFETDAIFTDGFEGKTLL